MKLVLSLLILIFSVACSEPETSSHATMHRPFALMGQTSVSPLDKIEHVVVLMLENRSFDNILGLHMDPVGLLSKSNTHGSETIPTWSTQNRHAVGFDTMPSKNPAESFRDMTYQLYEKAPPIDVNADVPTMGGFATNFANNGGEPTDIMHCFAPEQTPVFTTLARRFGLSDRWFASAPCQTLPNRLFLHSGTAAGYVNNLPGDHWWNVIHRLPYPMKTIFSHIPDTDERKGYGIYFHDFSANFAFRELWWNPLHFHRFTTFEEHVQNGTLPSYSFIEPAYFLGANDMHPPSSILPAQALTAKVYNILRGNEDIWKKTLFVVICDEHGGTYDSVPPPRAVSPGDGRVFNDDENLNFQFDRYGVRVPAIIMSPFVAEGAVLRSPTDVPFDHTTVIRTLFERFVPGCRDHPGREGCYLTERDKYAPSLASAITLDEPTNLGPEEIEESIQASSQKFQTAAALDPLDEFQQTLVGIAAVLPQKRELLHHLQTTGVRDLSKIKEPKHRTVRDAHVFVESQVNQFLGGR